MNKYKPVLIDTVLASILCAIFQGIISFLIFKENDIAGGYPAQLLLISFAFSFIATFIPLLGFNIYVKKCK